MATCESTTTEIYIPIPGTIQARALEALAASDTGSMAAGVLAANVGQTVVAPDLPDILAPCVQQGLITSERRSGLLFFDLTAHGLACLNMIKEGVVSRPDEPQAPLVQKKPEVKCKTTRLALSFSDAEDDLHKVDQADIECALTSSGRLLIDANGMQMSLSPEQAQALFIYTDRARAGKGR